MSDERRYVDERMRLLVEPPSPNRFPAGRPGRRTARRYVYETDTTFHQAAIDEVTGGGIR